MASTTADTTTGLLAGAGSVTGPAARARRSGAGWPRCAPRWTAR